MDQNYYYYGSTVEQDAQSSGMQAYYPYGRHSSQDPHGQGQAEPQSQSRGSHHYGATAPQHQHQHQHYTTAEAPRDQASYFSYHHHHQGHAGGPRALDTDDRTEFTEVAVAVAHVHEPAKDMDFHGMEYAPKHVGGERGHPMASKQPPPRQISRGKRSITSHSHGATAVAVAASKSGTRHTHESLTSLQWHSHQPQPQQQPPQHEYYAQGQAPHYPSSYGDRSQRMKDYESMVEMDGMDRFDTPELPSNLLAYEYDDDHRDRSHQAVTAVAPAPTAAGKMARVTRVAPQPAPELHQPPQPITQAPAPYGPPASSVKKPMGMPKESSSMEEEKSPPEKVQPTPIDRHRYHRRDLETEMRRIPPEELFAKLPPRLGSVCSKCELWTSKFHFTLSMWRRARTARVCMVCTGQYGTSSRTKLHHGEDGSKSGTTPPQPQQEEQQPQAAVVAAVAVAPPQPSAGSLRTSGTRSTGSRTGSGGAPPLTAAAVAAGAGAVGGGGNGSGSGSGSGIGSGGGGGTMSKRKSRKKKSRKQQQQQQQQQVSKKTS